MFLCCCFGCACFNYTTDEVGRAGQLFCVGIGLPEAEAVVFGVLADGEIAHLRDGGFGHADSAAEFFDFGGEFIHGIDADVIDGGFAIFATGETAVRAFVVAAGVDFHEVLHAAEGFDFPTEETVVEFLCALDVVCGDVKPNDACRGLFG